MRAWLGKAKYMQIHQRVPPFTTCTHLASSVRGSYGARGSSGARSLSSVAGRVGSAQAALLQQRGGDGGMQGSEKFNTLKSHYKSFRSGGHK